MSDTKLYRIRYMYRQWIGKPDPSGFGKAYLQSSDLQWLQRESQRLTRNGHRVLCAELQCGGLWARADIGV